MTAGILTLTTDFGADGPYVLGDQGVVLGLAPDPFVDVSHAIAPQNVADGSFVLAGIVDFFPIGTVHLAVVDPGVGTGIARLWRRSGPLVRRSRQWLDWRRAPRP